jgi:hypothetical protein
MMANSEMRAGRFAKLARGRRIFARMAACWDKGGFVRVGTCTKYWDLRPKHRDMVSMGKSGSIYMQRGKVWDCLDFCTFQFSA